MKKDGIQWYTKTIRINIDTGEQLTEREAKKYYTLIKTLKKIQYADKHKTRRYIEYTRLYKSRNQLELQFN